MGEYLARSTKPKQSTKPSRIPKNPEKAFDLGFKVGTKVTKDEVREEVLGYLETRYMGDDAPERGSVEGKAILAVAREMAEYLKTL